MGKGTGTPSLSHWKHLSPQGRTGMALTIISMAAIWYPALTRYRTITIKIRMVKWSTTLSCWLTVSHCLKARYPKRRGLRRKPHNGNKKALQKRCTKRPLCKAYSFVPACAGLLYRPNFFPIIDINIITRNNLEQLFPCARLRLYHSPCHKKRSMKHSQIAKKIRFFPDMRSRYVIGK